MIDRISRDRILHAMDDLMQERITFSEFASQFDAVQHSLDPIIQVIDCEIFECFEYFPKQFPSYDRWTWKYFNRVRLLLASDMECETQQTTRRSIRQGIAALTFIACLAALLHGWMFAFSGFHIAILAAVPIIALILWTWRTRAWKDKTNEVLPISSPIYETAPFNSFSEVLAARRSVANFESRKFCSDIEAPKPSLWSRLMNYEIRIFPQWLESLLLLPFLPIGVIGLAFVFALISPWILLYFAFPESEGKTWWRLGERKFVHY